VLRARGDIDADGKVAEYRLEMDVDGPAREVEALTKDVY